MKEMSKVKIFTKKSLNSILSEKEILSSIRHPLIANLNYAFQDKEFLFLIFDYLAGGDLRYQINKGLIFNESQIKFFISNLLLSLNYLHNKNILHRDIKPENLVFSDNGYLHLTDFGVSHRLKEGRPILDKSGTPGYISPEVLLNVPQNYYSDFFSVGVVCYELVKNKKLFKGKNKKIIAEKIMNKNINLNQNNIPEGFSIHIADFINKLLKRNCKERLGYNGFQEIKNHQWLRGVEWENIQNKNVHAGKIPFIPAIGDNFDEDLVMQIDKIEVDNYNELLNKINDSGCLSNFYFNYYEVIKNINEKTDISNKISSQSTMVKTSPTDDDVNINEINCLDDKSDLPRYKVNDMNCDKNYTEKKKKYVNDEQDKSKLNTTISKINKNYEKDKIKQTKCNLMNNFKNN